jgi:hypothetical protein
MNAKILEAESKCAKLLREKAAAIGANAIIGLDIDYNEVGGVKGILMVCMTGTAIKISPNSDNIADIDFKSAQKAAETATELRTVQQLHSKALDDEEKISGWF